MMNFCVKKEYHLKTFAFRKFILYNLPEFSFQDERAKCLKFYIIHSFKMPLSPRFW